jgi:hypothetical protein
MVNCALSVAPGVWWKEVVVWVVQLEPWKLTGALSRCADDISGAQTPTRTAEVSTDPPTRYMKLSSSGTPSLQQLSDVFQ